jgi:RNA polymerase sigma-70 factor (ECF subfamily)
MNLDLPDILLEQLCHGDAAAAERAFVAFEPYLRMVVRRQLSPRLRTKFDSADVVQSVWADVLPGLREGRWHFEDAAHLRAFLVRATRNRFLNRLRKYRTHLKRERPLAVAGGGEPPPDGQPRPSEFAQADEAWQELLALCPASHQVVLQLKQQGLVLDEIAARTGLHKSSVRRILYDVARRFAFRQGRDGARAREPGREVP